MNPVTINLDTKYQTTTWENFTEADPVGNPVGISKFSDKTVQIIGDLDAATIALEGSMDGTNWVTLTSDGTAAIEDVGLYWIWENPMLIRPKMTFAGGEEPSITVIIGTSSLS